MQTPATWDEYDIVVAAPLDRGWSAWFDDFTMTAEGGGTRLRGKVADQAALHGALARLRDLGITILDVHRLPGGGGGVPSQ